jgi:hypothetical protein
MAVPNIFGTATSAIPLSQLDQNFATAITLGNTAVYLGNTTTSLGNVTLTNVTISSGNVTLTGANVSGTANVSTLVVTGNQTSLGNVVITGNVSANIATFSAGMGVGGAASANQAIRVSSNALTTANITAFSARTTAPATVTGESVGFSSQISTAASAFTMAAGMSFYAFDANKGAGSTITNLHGVYIANQTQGTNNYGITSLVSSGTNKFNIYASGTAANYMAGQLQLGDGTAAAPALSNFGDENTGIFFPAADTIAFAEGGTEVMRIDSSGNVLIGATTSNGKLTIKNPSISGAQTILRIQGAANTTDLGGLSFNQSTDEFKVEAVTVSGFLTFGTGSGGTERMRIDSNGNVTIPTASSYLFVGSSTYTGDAASGTGGGFGNALNVGVCWASVDESSVAIFNRQGNDGTVVLIRQAGETEGTISVSGTTVSYNGGHLSRWAQTTTAKDESLVKGTVLSNLDEMNVYTDAEGNPVENEQLNKVKVSDVEGDANVAGVFVNWEHDEQHNVDEINMAMTGDMIIRIAQGVTVQRGDLLMSAGDGTAKPQGDDIVRSKTLAKVTSTHVTCTYADDSYCVPCVLMAC